MVAMGLVNKFTTAIKNNIPVINPSPTGICTPRNVKFALARTGVAENENREAVHREAPDHAESVEVRKKGDVAAADDDGDNLEGHDDIDDAIARPEPAVR